MTFFPFVRVIVAHLLKQRAYGMRVATSISALAIAVASVVIMASIGAGALQTVRDLVALEGVNIIYVIATPHSIGGVRLAQQMRSSLTVEDAIDMKQSIPEIRQTCWWRRDPTRLVYNHDNWPAPVFSISPSCQSVKGWRTTKGNEISDLDLELANTVAILGKTVVGRLFGGTDPVDSMVRIKNVPFRVIGVLEEKGAAPGGYDQDDIVLIPYTTAKQKLLGPTASYVEVIAAATYDREDLPLAAQRVTNLLRHRHRIEPDLPDDVLVRTQLEIETFYEQASDTLSSLFVMLASISLLVGGIGIMNILLVSVTERTREIGVRMAVGAKRRHILGQFLIEAMTLSVVGGCIGILCGILGARLTTVVAGWPTIISGHTVAMAFVCSVAVGLFFGWYPANKAARLNPIDALRYE